jgi:hypothetical protein
MVKVDPFGENLRRDNYLRQERGIERQHQASTCLVLDVAVGKSNGCEELL